MRLRLLVTVALVVGALVGVPLGLRLAPPERVAASATLALPPTGPAQVSGTWKPAPPPVDPAASLVADAKGSAVSLYSAPGVPLYAVEPLTNPTWEGLPLVFHVLQRTDGWLRVQVSRRPNGFQAWVPEDQVRLRRVPNRIRVEVGARRLTVLHGDTPLFATTVAVGRDRTPTPLGSFFVDGVVLLQPGTGAYGAAQLSVSAFSEVYTSFGGGVGQIALHGTNAPGLLGQAVSNGCVRLDNDSILKVLSMAPTGTPVEIVA